ncbi:Holliday junction resolvase [Clostridium botulinum]|nr:Holliday junction resolvase [Clostridium botulinum]
MKIVIPGELPDLNKIIDVAKKHYMQYSNLKKTNTDLVTWIAKGKGKFKRIDLDITWYCKNKRKDKDNIAAGIKFILDGLVKAKVIENDGWKEINNFTHKFEVDKNNPRTEIEIVEVK